MKRTSPVTTTSPNPARDPGWQFDGAPNGIRVRLRRPRLRAHSALARSLGNARAFPQSRDPNGFEPRPVNVTSPNPARDPGWQFDGAPNGIRVRLRRPRLRAHSALARSLGNARAFPQSRDPNGFEPRPVNVTSPNSARDPGWQFDGAPNGIRTRDIHLERVASLAARRWGQRARV